MEFIPGVFEVLQPSAPKERMTALEKKCAIRMENITKRFGSKVIANKDVNLELYEGEILSLLGENGSGKTTLMNMLTRTGKRNGLAGKHAIYIKHNCLYLLQIVINHT